MPTGTESGAGAGGKPQARPPVTGKAPGARVIPQSRHPLPVARGQNIRIGIKIIRGKYINKVVSIKLGVVYLPAP